jgi:hypothetical protein
LAVSQREIGLKNWDMPSVTILVSPQLVGGRWD